MSHSNVLATRNRKPLKQTFNQMLVLTMDCVSHTRHLSQAFGLLHQELRDDLSSWIC